MNTHGLIKWEQLNELDGSERLSPSSAPPQHSSRWSDPQPAQCQTSRAFEICCLQKHWPRLDLSMKPWSHPQVLVWESLCARSQMTHLEGDAWTHTRLSRRLHSSPSSSLPLPKNFQKQLSLVTNYTNNTSGHNFCVTPWPLYNVS